MFLLEDETQKIENNYENLLKKGMKILSKIQNYQKKTLNSEYEFISLVKSPNKSRLKIPIFCFSLESFHFE